MLDQVDRLLPVADDDISTVVKTKWSDIHVDRPCLEMLRSSPLLAALPRMVDLCDLVEDVEAKVNELSFRLPAADPLKGQHDYLAAIAAYTYDTRSGAPQQLYFQLNGALRQRGVAERDALLQTWGQFMHYMMKALSVLPDVKATCYRGYPDWSKVSHHYEIGAPIQWGAFTSTSTDVEAAKAFTDKARGVIFKVTVLSGRDIRPYSFFAAEAEVLLSPNHRFTVTSEPYQTADGYTMVDLLQNKSSIFYS